MYLHNNSNDFLEVINTVATTKGLLSQIVEKDYYVTLMLRGLAERLPFIVFKGGTSLSKCHKAINRFSEDIDLTIDIVLTQGQKKKVKQAITDVSVLLGMEVVNIDVIQSRKDYNRYVISYASVLPTVSEAPTHNIILETSYKTISFPTKNLQVSNYIAESMGEDNLEALKEFSLEPFCMKVQDINRTLADKVFAICDYYLEGKTERHSRHLYDIHKLLPLIKLDSEFRDLVVEVREGRLESKVCHSAKAGINPNEILNKIIAENTFKEDYEAVTDNLLNEIIAYGDVIASLKIVVSSEIFVF